jgi:hypothetical protein
MGYRGQGTHSADFTEEGGGVHVETRPQLAGVDGTRLTGLSSERGRG